MRLSRRGWLGVMAGGTGIFLGMGTSLADKGRGRRRRGRDDDDRDRDHEAAARARAAGEILPLAAILDHVRQSYQGEVVGIELEHKNDQWLYEIKLITPENRYLEIYVDARDKQIVKVEGQSKDK